MWSRVGLALACVGVWAAAASALNGLYSVPWPTAAMLAFAIAPLVFTIGLYEDGTGGVTIFDAFRRYRHACLAIAVVVLILVRLYVRRY